MSQCELPPCPPCPAPTPPPCPQVCPPPPPPPPCRVKPIMRGLHAAQTRRVVITALVLSAMGGGAFYAFCARPKIQAYKDFHLKAEKEDWADEMARKGLFQSVPRESLVDNKHVKK